MAHQLSSASVFLSAVASCVASASLARSLRRLAAHLREVADLGEARSRAAAWSRKRQSGAGAIAIAFGALARGVTADPRVAAEALETEPTRAS
jgi:hypothetical protein